MDNISRVLPDTKRFIAVICFLSVLWLTGCASLMQRLSLLNCQFRFVNIKPVKIGLLSSDLKLSIEVKNPNAVDTILDKLGFDFLINESNVFSGEMENKLTIPQHDRVVFNHIISISHIAAGEAIVRAIKRKKASYRLVGKAYFTTPLGLMAFPVDILSGEIE